MDTQPLNKEALKLLDTYISTQREKVGRTTRNVVFGLLVTNVSVFALLFTYLKEYAAQEAIGVIRDGYELGNEAIETAMKSQVTSIATASAEANRRFGELNILMEGQRREFDNLTANINAARLEANTASEGFIEATNRSQQEWDAEKKKQDALIEQTAREADAQLHRLKEGKTQITGLLDAVNELRGEGEGSVNFFMERLQALATTLKGDDAAAQLRNLHQEGIAIRKQLDDLLPSGAILPYYGDPVDLRRTGWVLCNGARVDEELCQSYGFALSDVASSFQNVTLPDLSDRFLRGSTSRTASSTWPVYGGSNNLPAHTHMHKLSIPDGGGHSHSGGDHSHPIPRNRPRAATTPTAASGGSGGNPTEASDMATRSAAHSHSGGGHAHSISGTVGKASVKVSGDGDDDQGYNQPAYMEVYFIIQIRDLAG